MLNFIKCVCCSVSVCPVLITKLTIKLILTLTWFQRDTARHLEWLKTVKDSHGSVELSSLSLASAINTKGIYIISAENQKKVC